MNIQLNSLENIIITDDDTEDEQIDNIIIPTDKPCDEHDEVSDHFDETKNIFVVPSDASTESQKTVRSIPYQVIAVNRIDDAEPIQSKTSFEFLSELPLLEEKIVSDPLEDKTQSINPSQDITNVIRSRYQALTKKLSVVLNNHKAHDNRYQAITKKHDVVLNNHKAHENRYQAVTKKLDVVQNNNKVHDKTVPIVPLIGTKPKKMSPLEIIGNTSSCVGCEALEIRVKRLESELSQSKHSIKHLEYKLKNSHKTVNLLKTRLRRREEKLTELTGREFKKFNRGRKNSRQIIEPVLCFNEV